jgi:uncharacterized iron-regulated membrane protein
MNRLNRKIHYWLTLFIALPLLVILATGLMLHYRKQNSWVQPTEQKGQGSIPLVSFERVLEACRGEGACEVSSWADIARVDVRPSKGILKVTCKNNQEVQIDLATGEVLQVAYRRSDMINAIHEGAYFGEAVKWYIFLPAGGAMLVMWFTGMWLFALPWLRKSRSQVRNSTLPVRMS